MDKDFDSNFTDEISFSTMSDDFQKLTDLPEGMTNSHGICDNTFKKKENQHRHMQNYGNNQMTYNSGITNMNGTLTVEQLREYAVQFSNYLWTHQPDILDVFQQKNTGNYEEDNERRTPLQFSYNHVICKLDFPGLIYQMAPNMIKYEGGTIMISDDIFFRSGDDLLCDDYPGPLSLEKTTEEQIYSFLKDQMCLEIKETNDWDSNDLLINYLELMIKESGKPRPISVLRLLNDGFEMKTVNLKNNPRLFDSVSRNSFSRTSSRATSRASSRPPSPIEMDANNPELPQNSLDTPQGPGSVSSAVHRALVTVSTEQKRYQNMDKYRQYIMTGRFEEAVHFAASSGIWDHAFALALRMSSSQLINEVLVKFSRQAISSSDPLYTMHELMAQRPPKIVASNRGFSSTEMCDWRCHLSMIFSVKKYRSEESRTAIEGLGEKLSALQNHCAAHLCYLLAGTPFGIDRTTTRYRRKFDLIGWPSSTSSIPAQKSTYANCHRLFSGPQYWSSAPDRAIQLTEVYEYALKCSGDSGPTALSIHLVPYKYQMVYRMLSRNRLLSAYEYCVDIGRILDCSNGDTSSRNWLQCEAIDFRIVANIREMGHRLNAWLHSCDESLCARDRSWLDNLDTVYRLFCDKYRLWNPDNRQPNFAGVEHTQLHPIDDDDDDGGCEDDSESVSDAYRVNSNGYGRYPDSVASSIYTEHYTDGFQTSPTHKMSTRPGAGHPAHQQGSTAPITSPKSLQQHQNLGLRLASGLVPLRDIAPPSDLPSEAIMTEPPRFQDHHFYQQHQPQNQPAMTSAGASRALAERAHHNQSSDSHRLRYDNQMKLHQQQQQHHQSQQKPVPPGRHPEPPYQQPIQFGSNRFDSFNVDSSSLADKLTRSTDRNSGAMDNTPGFIKQQPIGIRNAFVPPSTNDGDGRADDDEDSPVNCFVNSYGSSLSMVRSRSRSQSNGSVGSGGPRSRTNSDSKEPPHQSLQPSASAIRTLGSTQEEVVEPVKSSNKTPLQQHIDSGAAAPPQPPSAESKGALRGLFSRLIPSKPKEIHLPNDKDQSIMYDETKKRWIDKSNPESDKPLTPPPILTGALGGSAGPVLGNLNNDMYSPAVGGPPMNQFINSRYKLATTNVKPRTAVTMVPPAVMNMNMNPEQMPDAPSESKLNRYHLPAPPAQLQQQYNYNSIDYGAASPQHYAVDTSASREGYDHNQMYLSHYHHTATSPPLGEHLRNY